MSNVQSSYFGNNKRTPPMVPVGDLGMMSAFADNGPQGYTPPMEVPIETTPQFNPQNIYNPQQVIPQQSAYNPIPDLRSLDTPQASDYRMSDQDVSGYQQAPDTEALLSKIRKREGNYNTIGDIGDKAGLSVGAYQFTEKSGKANKLAKMLGYNSARELTPDILGSPQGRRAQDELVKQDYFVPAQRAAKQAGITDPKVINFLIDTEINGGRQNVMNRAKKMKGGLTLPNLIKAREARYRTLARDNPSKYGKFLKGWLNRLDEFKRTV